MMHIRMEDVLTLHSDIFKHYRRSFRPVEHGRWKTEVYFEYILQNINNMNELDESLTTTGNLKIKWKDTRLTWNTTKYSGQKLTYRSQQDVWKPDLVLSNGNSKIHELGNRFYFVVIHHTGDINWEPYEVLTTVCNMDMTYFPYDKQICYINFRIWSFSHTDVSIAAASHLKLTTTGNGIWAVEDTSSEVVLEDSHHTAKFKVVLRRKPQFFIFNVVLPIAILGLVSTVVFLIPVDSGEKTGFSMTVFLSFAVFISIVSAELPKNSDNYSLLSIYVVAEVLFSVFLLVISSIQLRLYHRKSTYIGPYWRKIIACSGKDVSGKCRMKETSRNDPYLRENDLQTAGSKETGNNNLPEDCSVMNGIRRGSTAKKTLDDCTWLDVSNALDVLFLAFFTIINIILTGTVFLIIGAN
ncbi:hypothetical protein FSP39_015984 [Pinctada imbricata]|uniref:Uncharacterized protein n=1 Tax=Pinctada imbricata TaxID=66713 RepID=A0AA88YRJ9_PINIB|nr:hypothetical protein FSP39_015984 [Pinctada imbricata]